MPDTRSIEAPRSGDELVASQHERDKLSQQQANLGATFADRMRERAR